jgi:hypothetical protein
MERLLAPERRTYLLVTLALITITYTWSSVTHLSELIEAEPELPTESSILRRAEQNIASHLHLKQGVASKQAASTGAGLAAGPPIWPRRATVCCKPSVLLSLFSTAEFRGMVGNRLPSGVQTEQQQQKPWATKAGQDAALVASAGATALGKPGSTITVTEGQCNMLNNTE